MDTRLRKLSYVYQGPGKENLKWKQTEQTCFYIQPVLNSLANLPGRKWKSNWNIICSVVS